MKLSIVLTSLLALSTSAFAGGSDTGSANENCAKTIMENYFAQSDALIEAYYKADLDSKIAPTIEARREAAVIALSLSREMEPEIKSQRRGEAIKKALNCK